MRLDRIPAPNSLSHALVCVSVGRSVRQLQCKRRLLAGATMADGLLTFWHHKLYMASFTCTVSPSLGRIARWSSSVFDLIIITTGSRLLGTIW